MPAGFAKLFEHRDFTWLVSLTFQFILDTIFDACVWLSMSTNYEISYWSACRWNNVNMSMELLYTIRCHYIICYCYMLLYNIKFTIIYYNVLLYIVICYYILLYVLNAIAIILYYCLNYLFYIIICYYMMLYLLYYIYNYNIYIYIYMYASNFSCEAIS